MNVEIRDRFVPHRVGRIFARSWSCGERRGGAPIVLLHDSLGCVELWRDFPSELCRVAGCEVIAYDRFGFGRSDERTGRLATTFVADEASGFFPAVLADFGIERFVALGHSVGGAMAVECAAGPGAKCEALVTISAQAFVEDRTLQGIREAQVQFRNPAQVERLAKYHGAKAKWVLDSWIGTWLSPEFADWSLAETLPRVACPVLAIHGELDEYGSARHPEMIGRLCGGPTRIELMSATGHVPHRERPQEVLHSIAGFLETVPSARARGSAGT